MKNTQRSEGTTLKTRSGLAQTLLAAAVLLGLSLLMLFASGCTQSGETVDAALEAPAQTLEERERAIVIAERELALAEREAALVERQTDLQAREAGAVRTASRVYRDTPRVPQTVEVFDPAPRRTEPTYRAEPAVYRRTSERLVVPAGTAIDVELLDSLSSANATPGMPFEARVANDVYSGGRLVIPAGASVSGTVVEAVGLRRIGGRAKLALDFDRVELASGRTTAMNGSYVQLGRRETARDAATIGGSAAAGAILGNQVNGRHHDRAKVLGAILGAGVGTAIAHRTSGGEVVLQAGTTLPITLDSSIDSGSYS